MKCYNHHDRDAFGICKSCGKGLCLECMKKEDGAVFCKNDKHCSSHSGRFKVFTALELIILFIILILTILD